MLFRSIENKKAKKKTAALESSKPDTVKRTEEPNTDQDLATAEGVENKFAGKPLGRPKKETEENKEELKRLKAQRREDYRQRIPIEGKFGQGKNGYRLNYIRAKRADTSLAWINSIFLVMNLLVLLRIFLRRRKSAITCIPFESKNPPSRVVGNIICRLLKNV